MKKLEILLKNISRDFLLSCQASVVERAAYRVWKQRRSAGGAWLLFHYICKLCCHGRPRYTISVVWNNTGGDAGWCFKPGSIQSPQAYRTFSISRDWTSTLACSFPYIAESTSRNTKECCLDYHPCTVCSHPTDLIARGIAHFHQCVQIIFCY